METQDLEIQESENDLGEACLTVMYILNVSWKIIINKPQHKETLEAANLAVEEAFDRAWKIIQPKSHWRVPTKS